MPFQRKFALFRREGEAGGGKEGQRWKRPRQLKLHSVRPAPRGSTAPGRRCSPPRTPFVGSGAGGQRRAHPSEGRAGPDLPCPAPPRAAWPSPGRRTEPCWAVPARAMPAPPPPSPGRCSRSGAAGAPARHGLGAAERPRPGTGSAEAAGSLTPPPPTSPERADCSLSCRALSGSLGPVSRGAAAPPRGFPRDEIPIGSFYPRLWHRDGRRGGSRDSRRLQRRE